MGSADLPTMQLRRGGRAGSDAVPNGERPGAGPADWPAVPGYDILGELGRGGMGVVYKARQASTGRVVALKMIAGATPELVARFAAEAEVLTELRHPNIVEIFEVGTCPAGPFLVMELAVGGSLFRRLAGTPQPARGAAALVARLARAVHAAHEKGVVHRDLKPGNVLLIEGPEVPLERCTPKISDFGLARRLDEARGLTLSGQVMGTPGYMAPEQAQGPASGVGPATDIYALGVLLYEALTGHPPYQGSTVLETVHLMLSAEPLPPTRQRRDLSRELEAVCLRCLEREPARRYGSARALAEDLERFLEGRPTVARPPRLPERLAKWARQHPSTAALAAFSLVLLLGGLALVTSQWLRAEAAHARGLVERDRAVRMADAERAARREAQGLTARLLLERGVSRCEAGDYDLGLALLASSRESAPDDDEALLGSVATLFGSWGRQLRPLRYFSIHPQAVRAATFDPAGKALASAAGRRVCRFDAATGAASGDPTELPADVYLLRHCGDRLLAVVWVSPRVVRVYTVPDGKPAGDEIKLSADPRAVALSADGARLLVAEGTSARLYEVATGKPVGRPLSHTARVRSVALSADGRRAATGDDDGAARVWATDSSAVEVELGGHTQPVCLVAFSPAGDVVLTGAEDRSARLWQRQGGKLLHVLPHEHRVVVAAFQADGALVATGADDNTVRLWRVGTGRPVGGIIRHADVINAVTLSPDGGLLVTASRDGTLRGWQVRQADHLGQYPHPHAVLALACRPDGKQALTACVDGLVRGWQLDERRERALARAARPTALAFHPRGHLFALGDGEGRLTIHDADSGRPVAGPWAHAAAVRAIAYSPDGALLAVGMEDGDKAVVLRDAANGEVVRRLVGHERKVVAVAFSPDGKGLLSGSWDRTARLWDVATGAGVRSPLRHQDLVQAVAFSPDGKVALTGGDDYTARLWDVATGKPRGAPVRHPDKVQAVGFAPCGRLFATAGKGGQARLWEARTGKLACPPFAHKGEIHSLAFTPGGRYLLTGGWDGAVRLWRAPAAAPGGARVWRAWLEVHTGLRLDAAGALVELDVPAWCQRVEELAAVSGGDWSALNNQ